MFLLWNRPLSNTIRKKVSPCVGDLVRKLDILHGDATRTGQVTSTHLKLTLQDCQRKYHEEESTNRVNMWCALAIIAFIMIATPMFYIIISFLLSVRCFLPNNSVVHEATRPVSDCRFCRDIKGPLILRNPTREQIMPHAYSSQPIIIKNAVANWPAAKILNFNYLKALYENTPGALDEDCKFLHFRSDLKTIRDVFEMTPDRVNLSGDHMPWYVGWSNCHTVVLNELRQLYPQPDFLPIDAEMANTDYIFLGYEQGAFMHLEYTPRLMWQGQLKGNKNWIVAPTPDCDSICQSFSFYIESGDALLVDTRNWYHGTSIPKGQFTLTIQSEYG